MRLVHGKQTGTDRAVSPPSPLQDYLERTVKYVPVEVISAFMVLRAVVPPHSDGSTLWVPVELAVYGALVVLTPLYLIKFGGNVPRKGLQVAVATIAFVVWSYATGGPFFWDALKELVGARQVVYQEVSGALLIIWSLVAGLIDPNASEPATVSSNPP
jgi:hypothetical protein